MVAARFPSSSVPAHKMAVMAGKLGLSTAPAVWPSGLWLLVEAYDTCRRCEAEPVCADWLARAPDSIEVPPDFCPNAATFSRAMKAKRTAG